ncbi:glycosyltransferase family 2 protein [Roseixanthobacter pseudopolyaromaticivorans]|uniref:glycosyltransferase family 2 protein n=1 Tax=Xanthobacteraceae TaxID=335928 RepID=UPI003729280B
MPAEISPLWLRAEDAPERGRRFSLPWLWRARLAVKEGVFAVEIARATPGDTEPLELAFLGFGGAPLGHATVAAPVAALLLPRGTATIAVTHGAALRLGLYPRGKLWLKLHAFAHGSFPGLPPHRRWRAAGAAARDLRGMHASLFADSPARQAQATRRYRRYRKAYVEDFSGPLAPAGATLSFLSVLGTDTRAEDLAACLAALRAQSDPHWEWLIGLPAGEDAARAQLTGEPRVRLLADAGTAPLTFNALLAAASGETLALLDPSGRPTRDAVAMLRAAFAAHADCMLAYTDEETLDAAGAPLDGVFKPAFNRHLLRAVDYFGDLVTLRTAHARAIGGARAYLPLAWRYDLLLRAAGALSPSAIRHIPRVGYGRQGAGGWTGFSSPDQAREAARALEDATGAPVEIRADLKLRPHYRLPDVPPLVSFVIPTRDRADLMGMALRSLVTHTAYRNFEIVIVDNGSVELETFALFAEIKAAWPRTIVVRDDGGFNYPRICNAGVDAASGDLICLLNNDIEVVEPGWLHEMVSLAALPQTGIVGAKLLFPDHTLQHAGVIAGLFRYAAHWFSHGAEDMAGHLGRLHARNNLSAVTGACLMISRQCWDQIGPLDAVRFAEDCNDIDLCLRARAGGFELVWTPFALLLHHESASRGRRRSKAHRERLKAQRARMEALWHTATLVDPHYNPNLARNSLHAGIAKSPEGSRAPRTDAIAPPHATP